MKMKEITSRQNETVVWAASLKEKKYREKYSCFLAEGVKLVKEALAARLPVTHLFVCEEKRVLLEEIEPLLGMNAPAVFALSSACFEKISTEKAPQGVIAVIKYLDFFKKTAKINKEDVSARALLLSSVRDPGNLGAIIRSAAAFGTETVILSADSADIYHTKVLRSSMGTLFRLRILMVEDVVASIEELRAAGRRFFAAELRDRAVPLSCLDLTAEDIFVIGNEGHGIDSQISAACDGSVYIPIQDGVESLNASVAASVLLWEQSKRM